MIYITTFDPVTKRANAASTDSGFPTLDAVRACMGDGWLRSSGRVVVYPGGVAFSDYPFLLTDPSIGDNVTGSTETDGGA